MSNDDLSLHDLAPIYALDALDGEELAAFEAHLVVCDACQADVAAFRDTAAELGHAVEIEPPPELREELLDRVASTPQVTPLDLGAHRRRRFGSARTLLAAAAAVVVIAGGIALAARDTAETLDSYTALLDEPGVVVIELDGTDGAAGTVSVAWSPERDRVGVSAAGLDDPPEGQVYALWLLPAEGAPVPAALFEPDGGVVSTVAPIEDLDSTGWGITLEPAGGSDEPTLPIIYAGSL